MAKDTLRTLGGRMSGEHLDRLSAIDNPALHAFVSRFVGLCEPRELFVSDGSPADAQRIRDHALSAGEERPLALAGHTVHFDGYLDQGRDKEHTGILVPKGVDLGPLIGTRDRDGGVGEVHGILKGIMAGKTMYVGFYSLGPSGSEFSRLCVQLTDSPYVAHCENILYRPGYEGMRRLPGAKFFKFVHSQGEVDGNRVSKNLDRRRIYIDLRDETVYSVNTQYGGNSIGLKKLAMRLAIDRASREGWLTEHMLVMGVHGPGGRTTYFTGAFPSLCGKTSTAMLEGETIIGDDIAYLRRVDGEVRAVNAEAGMFGIIQGVNSGDDPAQWRALHAPGELIFSNVLVTEDGGVHWLGKDGEIPGKGYNHSGEWHAGKKDPNGKEIKCSHPNARFTIGLRGFENLDPRFDDPKGVPVGGIVYGGRDSDTWAPVEEAFDWTHGIVTKGASLESETTAATLGKEGVREFNPMSNLDFLSVPIGRYISDNLDFVRGLGKPPLIFSVNYFLKDKAGNFLNERRDKRVWYKWMERRVHGEAGALKGPTGLIPEYDDLRKLFGAVLGKDYKREDYVRQFTVRIPENLAKLDRIKKIYETKVPDAPAVVFEVLEEQRERLAEARQKHGDYVAPERLG